MDVTEDASPAAVRDPHRVEMKTSPPHRHQGSPRRHKHRQLVAGYVVQECLGSGSFASVFKGVKATNATVSAENDGTYPAATTARLQSSCFEEGSLPEIAAIKVLHLVNGNDRKAAQSEIAILQSFRHRNLVELYMVQSDAKNPALTFMVMEYCSGGDLKCLIHSRENGRLSENLSRRLFCDLACGVKFLWDNRLVHRDIKPHNLLLTGTLPPAYEVDDPAESYCGNSESSTDTISTQRTFQLKIADFGLARSLGCTALAETFCGSPLYMAPEVLMNKKYDGKADLWSVGVVLFEMLSGQTPYGGMAKTTEDLLRMMKEQSADLPVDVKVSGACDELLASLLVFNPSFRADHAAFFTATDKFLRGGVPYQTDANRRSDECDSTGRADKSGSSAFSVNDSDLDTYDVLASLGAVELRTMRRHISTPLAVSQSALPDHDGNGSEDSSTSERNTSKPISGVRVDDPRKSDGRLVGSFRAIDVGDSMSVSYLVQSIPEAEIPIEGEDKTHVATRVWRQLADATRGAKWVKYLLCLLFLVLAVARERALITKIHTGKGASLTLKAATHELGRNLSICEAKLSSSEALSKERLASVLEQQRLIDDQLDWFEQHAVRYERLRSNFTQCTNDLETMSERDFRRDEIVRAHARRRRLQDHTIDDQLMRIANLTEAIQAKDKLNSALWNRSKHFERLLAATTEKHERTKAELHLAQEWNLQLEETLVREGGKGSRLHASPWQTKPYATSAQKDSRVTHEQNETLQTFEEKSHAMTSDPTDTDSNSVGFDLHEGYRLLTSFTWFVGVVASVIGWAWVKDTFLPQGFFDGEDATDQEHTSLKLEL